jgi:hypothetical protein
MSERAKFSIIYETNSHSLSDSFPSAAVDRRFPGGRFSGGKISLANRRRTILQSEIYFFNRGEFAPLGFG